LTSSFLEVVSSISFSIYLGGRIPQFQFGEFYSQLFI